MHYHLEFENVIKPTRESITKNTARRIQLATASKREAEISIRPCVNMVRARSDGFLLFLLPKKGSEFISSLTGYIYFNVTFSDCNPSIDVYIYTYK
jgi:hypothetical protein